ncbi:2-phospho-L-lactate transferase [Xanthobacteraceae bacterium A53D]
MHDASIQNPDAPNGQGVVVGLAGGVGGARLLDGLDRRLGANLRAIVNTGDDFIHLGLSISPDLDTVTYTLAGIANEVTGWGVSGETWTTMEALSQIGGHTWFRLGDKDLATHLNRTGKLREGQGLTAFTREHCDRLGIRSQVLPMSDSVISTIVHSEDGDLTFQDYFVRRQCRVRVSGFSFRGADRASATPEVRDALTDPNLTAVVICPSNPFVSIDPILAVPGLRALVAKARVPVIAVSPLIGGKAIKGPAAKMMAELGHECSTVGIADHYAGLLSGMVIDTADGHARRELEQRGLRVTITDTLMRTPVDRLRVADACLELAARCRAV